MLRLLLGVSRTLKIFRCLISLSLFHARKANSPNLSVHHLAVTLCHFYYYFISFHETWSFVPFFAFSPRMKSRTLAFFSVITTTIALNLNFNLNTISSELTLPITLSLAVFHASFCSAFVLPRSLTDNYARVEVKRHGNHGGDSDTEEQDGDNNRGRNRAENSKERDGGANNIGNGRDTNGDVGNASGAARSNGTANASNRAGNQNSGSDDNDTVNDNNGNNSNKATPTTPPVPVSTSDSQASSNRTAPGTLPAGFPPSLSTGGAEVSVNGTSSDTDKNTGSGSGSGNETATRTGTGTGTGTLPEGFPPPVPTIAGFVAGDELGNHPRSRFEQAAKLRKELIERKRRRNTLRSKARTSKESQGKAVRSSYDV